MAKKDEQIHLVVLGYASPEAAQAGVTELDELKNSKYMKATDWAIISKDATGKVKLNETKSADAGATRGGLVGAFALGMVALAAAPVTLGAVAVGGAVGAVAAALHDGGFKNDDMRTIAGMMREGRAILLFSVAPEQAERATEAVREIPAFTAAEWSRGFTVSAGKDGLKEAIAQFNAERGDSTATPTGSV